MYLALMADIHANLSAMRAVLNDIYQYSADAVIIAGDLLGYYPDAEEVIEQIINLELPLYAITGNHDIPILQSHIPKNVAYKHILYHNFKHLSRGSLSYLQGLKGEMHFEIKGLKFSIYHGTPENPLNGRLYPDEKPDQSWFSNRETDVVILGHTHYPCIWCNFSNTIIINPGSVGQPRDGNPAPSWALLNTETMALSFNRVDYDRTAYAQKLRNINWDERTITALFKNKRGALNTW